MLPKRSGEGGDDDHLRLGRFRTELLVDARRAMDRPPARQPTCRKTIPAESVTRGCWAWLRDGASRADLTASGALLGGDATADQTGADEADIAATARPGPPARSSRFTATPPCPGTARRGWVQAVGGAGLGVRRPQHHDWISRASSAVVVGLAARQTLPNACPTRARLREATCWCFPAGQ